MKKNDEIFLSDTTMTLESLERKLNDVYDISLVTSREKQIYIFLATIYFSIIVFNLVNLNKK
jgi:hypothetical protein